VEWKAVKKTYTKGPLILHLKNGMPRAPYLFAFK